ncbi:MAG: hypothetical protein KBD63_07555, partial [Bacteriovoracaceae bacterium]|nr:hypothetical protein [Bacteriovoracaceae bacterium]
MTIISPSLLSCNFLEIQKELDIFKNCQDLWFHLDIMDGHFVPNLTFGLPIVEKIAQATLKPLDAHFMVTNPDFFADQFEKIKIHNFTFHWEACHHHDRMIQKLKNIYPSVGFSLNPSTPLSV